MTYPHRLGLVSVSFRSHTPEEILSAMQAAALSYIEWGSDVHAPCHDLPKLTKIAALQQAYGITCSSYGTYFRLGETPMSELEAYLRAADLLGTKTLRLWCGKQSGAQMTREERTALLSLCDQATKIAAHHGATLCLECHKNTFTERPCDAVWLMEAVHSPHLRMYWQPFQWQSVSENIANAHAIAPYTEHLHVFHWKKEKKLPLADALHEWHAYLQAFPAPHTLLLEFMPADQITELAAEAAALRKIVGEEI